MHEDVAECVAAIVEKMPNRDKRRVAAKPEAAKALAAKLKAWIEDPSPTSSARSQIPAHLFPPIAGVLSWARASNRGDLGRSLNMCSHEKCATYVCLEHLVKMCQSTFRDDVSFHAVDLCAALTGQEETFETAWKSPSPNHPCRPRETSRIRRIRTDRVVHKDGMPNRAQGRARISGGVPSRRRRFTA